MATTESALLILAGASLSAGLGWAGLLLLRYARVWPIGAGILLKAIWFALVRVARAACAWLAFRCLFGAPVEPLPVLVAIALGCAPLLFAFLHFIPHFGWMFLGLLEIMAFFHTVPLLAAATERSTGASALVLAASWLLVWLIARLVVGAAVRPGRTHPRRLEMDEVLSALPADAASLRV